MEEYYKEMARRLAAAYISSTMRITLNYAYNRYCKDEEPAEQWIELAKSLDSN